MPVNMPPVPTNAPELRERTRARYGRLKPLVEGVRPGPREDVTVVVDTPDQLVRKEARRDSKWKEIDALNTQQALAWLKSAVETPQGRIKVLKYLFCKLHEKL